MAYLDSFILVSDKDKPFITLRERSITFSKSAIEKLHYTPYVHMYINQKARKAAFQECEKDDDAIPFFKEPKEGRPVFVLYVLKDIPDPLHLMKVWNDLAMQNGLSGIHFISYTDKNEELKKEPFIHTDGIILSLLNSVVKSNSSKKSDLIKLRIKKLLSSWLKIPLLLYDYKEATKFFLDLIEEEENIIPEIIPNWDYTPRQGAGNLILKNSTPSLFEQHVSKALELIKNKPENKQIIFLKSWNEWGEGNYMEPDMTWGRGYLDALRNAINHYKESE